MTRVLCLLALLAGTGYWLSSSAADPRGTPRERDLQAEVDQLRIDVNDLRARLESLEAGEVRQAAAPTFVRPSPRPPAPLPEVEALPAPLPPDRPEWAPEGSQRGEINGHEFYIIPLDGEAAATIRH
jgi:hypothetical protein